jgi:protein-disulfide isomerase
MSEYIRLASPVGDGDRIRGPAEAPLTLVEYGDYDCPYTVRAYYVVRGLQKRLGDSMRFVFRVFPLTEIHENAQIAAEAAEAAAAQGGFWEMHDRLFEAHRRIGEEDLSRYAQQLGLNPARFERDLAKHSHASEVRGQIQSGLRSDVRGTPTFFVNGIRHEGSHDLKKRGTPRGLPRLRNIAGGVEGYD